jgi:hypothetical protein
MAIRSNIHQASRIILLISILLCGINASPNQDRTRRVRFERGRTSTVIKDSVVRGTRDNYVLGARKGQTLIVHITSAEDNAVFDLYQDGDETRLAEEATDLEGELPDTGDYVISVGGTRGNASYTLEITIR